MSVTALDLPGRPLADERESLAEEVRTVVPVRGPVPPPRPARLADRPDPDQPLTYAIAPLRDVVFAAQHMPPAAAAKFSSSVTLFGYTLSNAACIGITCAFAVAFLALAVTGSGKPD